jgi:hypothetical protein
MRTCIVLAVAASIAILAATVPGHGQQTGPAGWWVVTAPPTGLAYIIELDHDGSGRVWDADAACWAKGPWYDIDGDWLVVDADGGYAWHRALQPGIAEEWHNRWVTHAAFPCGASIRGCPGYSVPPHIYCDEIGVKLKP